jgi:hypothetical protein
VQAEVLRAELCVEAPVDERLGRPEEEFREYVGAYESQTQVVTLAISGDGLVLGSGGKGSFPEPDSPPRPAGRRRPGSRSPTETRSSRSTRPSRGCAPTSSAAPTVGSDGSATAAGCTARPKTPR